MPRPHAAAAPGSPPGLRSSRGEGAAAGTRGGDAARGSAGEGGFSAWTPAGGARAPSRGQCSRAAARPRGVAGAAGLPGAAAAAARALCAPKRRAVVLGGPEGPAPQPARRALVVGSVMKPERSSPSRTSTRTQPGSPDTCGPGVTYGQVNSALGRNSVRRRRESVKGEKGIH